MDQRTWTLNYFASGAIPADKANVLLPFYVIYFFSVRCSLSVGQVGLNYDQVDFPQGKSHVPLLNSIDV